jgi:hypothetical protein
MHFTIFWIGGASLILVVVLVPLGIHFFDSTVAGNDSPPDILLPWVLLVVFTAINLVITTFTALLEGCGKVTQIAVLRLWQSVLSVASVWIILGRGGQLYALVGNSLMVVLIGGGWLFVKYRFFIKDLFKHNLDLPGLNWRQEIWPFQWRVAISWMSGYIIFQLFNPLLFKTHGSVAAGQMGMSMQIMGALNGAAMAWITTKAPTYGKLVAIGRVDALDNLFVKGLFQSVGFLLLTVCGVFLVFFYFNATDSIYSARILPLKYFFLLGFVCIGNHFIFAEAAYMRAYKQEPFVGLSIVNAMVTAFLAFILIPPLGAAGAVYSYAVSNLLIGLGVGTTVFLRKRRQWKIAFPR